MAVEASTAQRIRRRHRLFSFAVFVILASLDNAAAGVLPPLYAIIARDLQSNDAALGFVTAVYLLIVAAAAAFWGYRGDKGQRKQLLFYGTLVWVVAMTLTAFSQTFWQLLVFQLLTAAGVGCISSVGFSVVSDLIPAHRRGLALSLWSISQGGGGGVGALLAGTVGAYNWRWPFLMIAAVGFLFTILYLFTNEPQRGRAEPELASVFAAGKSYRYHIALSDLPLILTRRTNIWLIVQSFFFALAYGSTIWIPRWAIARFQAEGYGLEVATIMGNLFVALFSLGFFFSVPAGYIGDRWQQRNPRGRTTMATIGLLASIPFFIALFFVPLEHITLPLEGNLLQLSWAVVVALFTNGWAMVAFVVALLALAFYTADAPNWAALLTDVNLPEHRGTVIGITRIVRAVANAASVGLAGYVFTSLSSAYPPPVNYAIGLSLFQLIAIFAALCYVGARKGVAADIRDVKQTLSTRAGALHASSSDSA